MAITTQPGADSTDLTTLLGSELADTFALTDSKLFIDGLAGNDTVTAAASLDTLTVDVSDGTTISPSPVRH